MKWITASFRFLVPILFLAILPVHISLAQIIDPQNVYIVSAESKKDDAPVNILVRENKLEIVTRDEVSLEDGTVAVDGEGGFSGDSSGFMTRVLLILDRERVAPALVVVPGYKEYLEEPAQRAINDCLHASAS